MADKSSCNATLQTRRHVGAATLLCLTLGASMFTVLRARATADPPDPPPPPLPAVTPTASDWMPKFPFPYDATRKDVTDADITAEREMCQWFNAQYAELRRQMNEFGF